MKFKEKIDAYFSMLDDGCIPTLSGFQLHLGITREGLADLKLKHPYEMDIALLRIETALEDGLINSANSTISRGCLYSLQANFLHWDLKNFYANGPGSSGPSEEEEEVHNSLKRIEKYV